MAVNKEEKPKEGRSTSGVTTAPEGGWGWMIVAGCFLATICIRAVTRCVSIFFVEFQLHFEQDYSTTAWIHSLIDCTTMLCAPLGGFLGSRVSCRATVILGGLLSAAGFILSSFASSLEYLYTSLGILTGLGFALSYTPAIAMVGRYFNERKALAYGIAQSGSGIGTFILAPVVQLLIEQYSWRGALLILGGFVSNLCVVGALMKPLEPRGEGKSEKLTNSEHDCLTTVLDTKDTEKVPADCSQGEPKQLEISNLKETRGLLISNGAFKNIRLENDKLTEIKIAECILFSNKLTETVLGEIKRSDAKLANGSTIEDMKLIESMILSGKADKTDLKTEDPGLTETKPDTVSPPPALVNTNPSSRSRCFCLESTEEFGFLVRPDFLILSVSFLFLAYGCSAPVVYLVPYALSVGVDHKHAAFLMSIFGVSGIVGNITFGWVTDRKCLKKYRMLSFMVALGLEGLCCMFAPLLRSFSLLVSFAVLYGYFDGAYVALIPVVTSDIVGSTHLTSGLGVVYFLHAIPYLISPPIGGWLVDRTGDYAATFLLSGACFMLSSAVLISTMLVRRCRRSKCSSAAHLDPNRCASVDAQQGII
ncbi:monocarboxylate transporter 12-B-like isoform X1 [Hippoglossus hippoglossus]|uniref:monocarboxylate transporter 12-B-like isoform X1 n=1 Tax=Hippoglossus hippoglossus TaxID=8267 RepID=UPI00148D4E27|nr:monocarboxylate transporter 12-B-like isoform X1 [Hippoglossus hippoglossus]XP_034465628.1 monocarboxylate transporter 12-B-like isoform X1 [Hippoglossus hippoglossus]